MASNNPFNVFRLECEEALAFALGKLFPEIKIVDYGFEKPPNIDFGELASSVCFVLAKQLGEKPVDLAEQVVAAVDVSGFDLIAKVEFAGAGYVNFHVDFSKFSRLTLESISELNEGYGFVKIDHALRMIVEHTSVNPLHPIHVGQARNPILGDAISRMLVMRGHSVKRHYYVDDVGRQSSVIAYGYEKLGKPEPDVKPDLFIGRIYTMTSCLVEINRLKKELQRAKEVDADDEAKKVTVDLDDWVAVASDLQQRYPELFGKLLKKIGEDENPELAINLLNRAYEAKEKKACELVRKVSELCLSGFRETLSRVGVGIDSWDWESDFVWSGHVNEVFQKLKSSAFTFADGGVLEFDAEKVVDTLGLRDKLGLREDYEVPALTLVRADGTTLYTTRDVAYTLWKFGRADRVVNVIGMEQSLAQLQLKIALYALGYGVYADNLVHFAYNLVSLPGYKMSARRGRFVSFDEVMDEAVNRAFEEVSKRSPELNDAEKKRIATFVGLGAVRYALVEVDSSKPVVFTWDRVLNFERNSAPYVQYTHARACSILRKAGKQATEADYGLLSERLEHEIVLLLAGFPDVFVEATDYLKPNLIADYANGLADKFNTFYNAFPVIKAEPEGLSNARLALTNAVRTVLANGLNLIGVTAPEKM